MPSRYENRDHSLFSTPSQGTWRKLNNFLASSIKTEEPSEEKALPLSAYSVDELITEIKRRGATAIQVNF